MKKSEIANKLNLTFLNNDNDERDYLYCFASDLMSDVLYLVHNENDTFLITGLCNMQSLRTAEMLDIDFIIYVRNKEVPQEMIDNAKEMGISIASFSGTMFKCAGMLYELGVKEAL